MKILHFILGKGDKNRANGVNQVIAGLAKFCAHEGATIRVVGKTHSLSSEPQVFNRDGFVVEAYEKFGSRFTNDLMAAITWADVVHLHGVYSPINLWVAKLCRRVGRPYLVTLHDGLAPERAIASKKLLKRFFHTFIQRRYLEQAAAIHVLTEEEASDLLSAARPRDIFLVPNGVDLNDFPGMTLSAEGQPSRSLTIGYLGRLSPEKNLESFCQAFSRANDGGELRLKLAGPINDYGKALQERYAGFGVELVGPKFGSDKNAFIGSLDLFVHPSLCDVFSIASMEVMAIGTPLLITRSSKASYFYNRNAFFMCEPTVYGIERGIRDALAQRADWAAMSQRGRELIETRLNWSAAAKDMMAAYQRILADAR